jgi:hypothetical protein
MLNLCNNQQLLFCQLSTCSWSELTQPEKLELGPRKERGRNVKPGRVRQGAEYLVNGVPISNAKDSWLYETENFQPCASFDIFVAWPGQRPQIQSKTTYIPE